MLYLILFLSSFFLTYVVRVYAIKKSLLAEVTDRSSHTVATPHGGGIAISITWFLGLLYLYTNNQIESNLFYALIIGIIISVVSYFDDLFELSPKTRLISQSLVAIGCLVSLGGLESLNFIFFTIENQFFTNLFAFFMIIWFINLYNFLDGIDGYAGIQAIFLAIAGYVLFGGSHFIILCLSVLGFLLWNYPFPFGPTSWRKAKIFMGDVGSTLLGYNIAVFTIFYTNLKSENLWVWLILFGVFWFDATLTLFRRWKDKEKLSHAHKKHAYQRLTQSGWSHNKVVIASVFVNMLLFIVVYFLSSVLTAFFFSLMILYVCIKFVDSKKRF